MKITQEVREYARAHGLAEAEAVEAGLHEKAEEFKDGGADIYIKS